METTPLPLHLPPPPTPPNPDKIKQKLIRKGVYPTPKIIHTLRKKHIQKHNRRLSKQPPQPPSLTPAQQQSVSEETHFQIIKSEYKAVFTSPIEPKSSVKLLGRPWEGLERLKVREIAGEEYGAENKKLMRENLWELSEFIERERDKLRWVLDDDDDVEIEDGWFENGKGKWDPTKRRCGGDAGGIRFLVDRLSGCKELTMKDWKFSKMMKQSGLQFTEGQLMKIVERLGDKGQWRHALSVVEWVYKSKEHEHFKSRFVYTKLLAVLGKARRPHEALQVFNWMRGDCHIYPDMPAYHSIAVTLGQAGLLKELVNIIECMKRKPSKRIKNMRHKNWDPVLQPDVVVYNAVLNACVPPRQWKGVSWVFEQLRKSGLKPNGATYGLAMEVMLQSGKCDLVHEFFEKMKRSGQALKALTYKVLVKAFWKEGKVDEAVQAVREMEQRGVVGIACVYYELACCLCNAGRWQEAMVEIQKLKRLPHAKPLEVTFTGMILSSMEGGHVDACVYIYENSKDHCVPDIGIINAMLKVYARNDMFSEAKYLFEETKRSNPCFNICPTENISSYSLSPDAYTYSSMLKASASALQWEYFEYVYKEMALAGYQIYQNKQGSLLLEASRAGKWYLLEHAFDMILEAGDIPPSSFFTEMVCQAIVRHDYERALTMVNTIGHAPFQVSEQQWKDIFEENADRINRTSLKELADTLCNYDLAMESSVSNFSRALQSLCGPSSSKDLYDSVAFGNSAIRELPSGGCNMGFHSDESIDTRRTSTVDIDTSADTVKSNPNENLQINNSSVNNILSVNHNGNGEEDGADMEIVAGFSNYSCSSDTKDEHLAYDLAFIDSDDSFDDRNSEYIEHEHFDGVNEVELDMSTCEEVESHIPDSPSANEILENWKKSREKDGIYFPLQLGWK